ncbi:YadA-like family protein [Burkholderia sp. DN3021]|uniref:YadA-like family protein n=1 Tax=Burkholderia sp. DN3021 TaxID=3410137 RepID=UPI003C7D43AA
MNKIYRTIWNKALGAFVAASEVDRAHGKGASRILGGSMSDNRVRLSRIAYMLCAIGLVAMPFDRANACSFAWGGTSPGTTGNNAVTCTGMYPLAVNSGEFGSNDLGAISYLGGSNIAYGYGNLNTAIGERSRAGTAQSVTDGWNQALGSYATASTGLNGTGGAQAVGVNATASANYAQAFGTSATASQENSVAIGPNAVSSNAGAVALGAGSVTSAVVNTPSATIGGQSYTFSGTNAASTVSVGATGTPRTVTNVAAGRVSTTSTDAINGSQLNAAVTAINTLSTSTSTGISSLSTGLSTTNSNVGSLSTGLSTVNSNIASLSTGVANAVQYDSPLRNSVTLGGVGATTPVRLTNVAAGTAPTDAVNFGQLSSLSTSTSTGLGSLSTGLSTTNSNVASLSTGLGSLSTSLNATNSNVGSLSTGLSTTNSNVASLSTSVSNLSTTLNNVNSGNTNYYKVNDPNAAPSQASGQGAMAGGGGAVASGDRSVALGKDATATGTNSVAIGAGSVATDPNTASFGTPGNERRLTNIAAGVNPTDATNLQQVNNAVAAGVGQANSYTDRRIADTNKAIGDVAKHAYSGIAAATALTMIPEVDLSKSIAVGVGAASFQGRVATAIGVSARLTENLKLKAGVGLSSGGQTYGGGMSYQW